MVNGLTADFIVQDTERFVVVWKRAKLFAVLATIVVWSGCLAKPTAHTVKPPEFTPALKALLDENHQRYDADEQMLEIVFRSPGYHTHIASGTHTSIFLEMPNNPISSSPRDRHNIAYHK